MRGISIWWVTLALASGLVSPAAAESQLIRDDQGRVVLEIREDGTMISYSYDAQGHVVKSDRPDGSKMETQPDAGEHSDSNQ